MAHRSSHRRLARWRAYYRGRFLRLRRQPIDNPDQRIQQDIDVFTTGTGPETNTPTVGTSQTLVVRGGNSIVSVVAFAPILWNLSGPLTLFGVTVPKALFWMALLYVLLTTVVAFWIGQPLIRLSLPQRADQRRVPLRAGPIARCRRGGRPLPRRARRTHAAAEPIRRESSPTTARSSAAAIAFIGWNRSMSQIVDPLPMVVQAPRMFAGRSNSATSRSPSQCVRHTCRARCASSATCTTRSRATGPRSSGSTGWSPRTNRQGRYRR